MKVRDLFKEFIDCNLDANLIIKPCKLICKGSFKVEVDNIRSSKQKEIVLHVGTKNASN